MFDSVSLTVILALSALGGVGLAGGFGWALLRRQSQRDAQLESITRALMEQAALLEHAVDANHAGLKQFGATLKQIESPLHQAAKQTIAVAASLKTTQDMIPQLAARVTSFGEITRLTGQQVARTLEGLKTSEQGLRATVAQNQLTARKYADDAADLSQRLVATVQLLRSGGRALAETNELAKVRTTETIGALMRSERSLRELVDHAAPRLLSAVDLSDRVADLAVRTEANTAMLTSAVRDLLQHAETGGQRMSGAVRQIEGAHDALARTVTQIAARSEQVDQTLRQLRAQHDQLMKQLATNADAAGVGLQQFAADSEHLLARIEAQLALASAQTETELRQLTAMANTTALQTQNVASELGQATQMLLSGGQRIEALAGNMQGNLIRLDHQVADAAQRLSARTEDMATQNEARLTQLQVRLDDMTARLGALGQLTATMGQVAGQLGQIIPSIGVDAGQSLERQLRAVADAVTLMRQELASTLQNLPAQLQQGLGIDFDNRWQIMLGQVEATRQDVLSSLAAQSQLVERVEETGGFVADHVTAPSQVQLALGGIVAVLGRMAADLRLIDQRLPPRAAANDQPTPSSHRVEQALSSVSDIFSSLRDRGDDVVNRLTEVAYNLHSAADRLPKDGR